MERSPCNLSSLFERAAWTLSKISRLRFWYLATCLDTRFVSACFILSATLISMIIMGSAAYFTRWPLVFPSLGPTAFLIFYAPASPMSSPRSTVFGHMLGAVIGWGAFHIVQAYTGGTMTSQSISWAMIISTAIALGLTGFFMTLTGIIHPPAASTALLAAMGVLNRLEGIIILELAVMMLTLEAWILHRISGVHYPLWGHNCKVKGPEISTKLGKLTFIDTQRQPDMADIAACLASRQRITPCDPDKTT